MWVAAWGNPCSQESCAEGRRPEVLSAQGKAGGTGLLLVLWSGAPFGGQGGHSPGGAGQLGGATPPSNWRMDQVEFVLRVPASHYPVVVAGTLLGSCRLALGV